MWQPVAPQQGYDLWVYGPNGFVRMFRDAQATTALPECRAEYDEAGGNLVLTLTNTGLTACMLTLRDEAYSVGAPVQLNVLAGQQVQQRLPLHNSAYWYDFSLTDAQGASFLRRFAGRMETGKHGLSDPAMGTM
jgi:phospholipase C